MSCDFGTRVYVRVQSAMPCNSFDCCGGPSTVRKASGSQTVTFAGDQVTGTVEYSANHAAYNEFGTGRRGAASGNAAPGITYNENWPGMSGSPYIRPALDESKPGIKAAFAEQGFTI